MLYFIFFTFLAIGLCCFIALIFVRREPANLTIFLLFALLTIAMNAVFLMSLENNEQQLRTVSYILGALTLGVTILRFLTKKVALFCSTAIALLFSFSFFAAFFL